MIFFCAFDWLIWWHKISSPITHCCRRKPIQSYIHTLLTFHWNLLWNICEIQSLWYKLCVRYLNTKMISFCGHFCDFKWLEWHFKNFLVFLFKLHILLFFFKFSFKCVLTTLVLAALTLPAREDSRVLSLLFIFSDSETSLLVVQPWRSWWNFHRGSEK